MKCERNQMKGEKNCKLLDYNETNNKYDSRKATDQ